MMEGERLDLTALDPSVDGERWEVLIAAILQRAGPELALRAERGTVVSVLGRWAWPVLAAASLVALLSGGALTLLRPQEAFGTVLQSLRLSEPVALWLEDGGPITTGDVLIALDEGVRE
jgi:hypothetical protein